MHARAYIVAAEVYVEWVVTMSVHIMGHVPLWEGLAWKSYLFDKKKYVLLHATVPGWHVKAVTVRYWCRLRCICCLCVRHGVPVL